MKYSITPPLLLFLVFVIGFLKTSSAQGDPNELLKQIKNARENNDHESLVQDLNTLAFIYLQSNIDSSEIMLNQSRELAAKYDVHIELARANIFSGYMELYRGNFPKSSDYFNTAIGILTEGDDLQTFASCYNGLGAAATQSNDYDTAIIYYQKTYDILFELGKEQESANALANIGNIHFLQMNFEKGLEYYLRALEIRKKTEIKGHYLPFQSSIANAYCELGDYNMARRYAKEGLAIAYELNYPREIGYHAGILGKVYFHYGNCDSAIYYSDLAVSKAEELKSKFNLVMNLSYIAKCKAERKDFDKAVFYADKAKENIIAGEKREIITVLDAYVTIYDKKGDYEKALEYFREYSIVKDSIYTEEQKQIIAELETSFDLKHKEQQIVILDKENQINRRNIQLLTGGVILMLIIISLVILIYLKTKKANRDLINKNLELMKIDQKNSELSLLLKQYTTAKKDEIITQMERLIFEENIYSKTKISLDEIAHMLNTNRTYLSKIINDHYQCNFNTLINQLRISEARKKLIDPANSKLTIEAIGIEVGFASKSAFNSAFKKETGITPSYFMKSVINKN